MKLLFFRYIVIVVLWYTSMTVVAYTNHVIVAFDRAIPKYESTYRDANILSMIDQIIQKQIQTGDLSISVVGYSMNGDYPDIDDFVQPYTDRNGNPALWKNYNSLCEIFPSWPKGEPSKYYYNPGSMQSLAKPYCVMETATKDVNYVADATYVIFVTDEKVQGVDDDYNREWEEMSWYNKGAYENIHDSVFKKLQLFNETYRFEFRNRRNIVGEYVIASYELLPTVQPSIYSVSNLPSPLPFKRVRGGYNLEYKVESHDIHYEVKDWAVYSPSGSLFKRNNEGSLLIKSHELNDGDTLEVRMVLRMSDDLYGGFLLSRRNCDGMALRQVIRLHNETKIFGFLPLSDSFWWWFCDDVVLAVVVWDVILLLVFIIIMCILTFVIFKKTTYYIPENKVIKISSNN